MDVLSTTPAVAIADASIICGYPTIVVEAFCLQGCCFTRSSPTERLRVPSYLMPLDVATERFERRGTLTPPGLIGWHFRRRASLPMTKKQPGTSSAGEHHESSALAPMPRNGALQEEFN
ncbi:hypothetical protein PUNSTDRAFT_52781 [Punctularia strigosozonata HHB-11173 SS5]|uniref:uncharacterized protein n=1 Tax=Punctularia strigosozonata (strain HHB-11173) TaxID=741275 RepID=UPI000441716B|nr:uncharacterized protein PUNSTDRAFT_52781 [Punctularia strigosozonata HHB-11173 SS5]EIN08353.1 hypothetical protein PUNSTDRAFT_52781 [Punctularia strigosozonata HHB-11173 SS5]